MNNSHNIFFSPACFISLFAALFIFSPSAVSAGGGGRAPITVLQNGVAGGQAASIVAKVTKDNDAKISVGEQGFFKIRNAGEGQNCLTKNQVSDNEGKIYGSCSSPVSGQIDVYLYFPDKVEDASSYKVTFADKGQSAAPVTLNYMQKSSSAPCGSGLVSYGWDESDGRACEQFQYDAWTAFCANGYKQHTKIGKCMHANDLSSHPEWKQLAEAMCNDKRCTPEAAAAMATPAPVVPPLKRATTEITDTIISGQEKNAPNVVRMQYLLTDKKISDSGIESHLFLKTKVGKNDGRAYFVPIPSVPGMEVSAKVIPTADDPWEQLNNSFGMSFSPTKGYLSLATEPKLFGLDKKKELYSFLKEHEIKMPSSLTQALDSILKLPAEPKMMVIITEKLPEEGMWLPPIQVDGADEERTLFFLPVAWNNGHISQEMVLNMEIGSVSQYPFFPINQKLTSMHYDFRDQMMKIADSIIASPYLSIVNVDNLNVRGDWLVSIRWDDQAKVVAKPLPKSPPATAIPEPISTPQSRTLTTQKVVVSIQRFVQSMWHSFTNKLSGK